MQPCGHWILRMRSPLCCNQALPVWSVWLILAFPFSREQHKLKSKGDFLLHPEQSFMFAVNSNDLPSQNKYLTLIFLPAPKRDDMWRTFLNPHRLRAIFSHHPIYVTRYLVCVNDYHLTISCHQRAVYFNTLTCIFSAGNTFKEHFLLRS
jgi:hypothetical protein